MSVCYITGWLDHCINEQRYRFPFKAALWVYIATKTNLGCADPLDSEVGPCHCAGISCQHLWSAHSAFRLPCPSHAFLPWAEMNQTINSQDIFYFYDYSKIHLPTLCMGCTPSWGYSPDPWLCMPWGTLGGPGLGPIMLWTEPGEGPGPGLGPKIGPGERPAPGEGPGWDIPTDGSVGVDICQVWSYEQDKKNTDTKRYVHVIHM